MFPYTLNSNLIFLSASQLFHMLYRKGFAFCCGTMTVGTAYMPLNDFTYVKEWTLLNKRYWAILLTYILMQLSGIVGIPLLLAAGMDITQSVAVWSIFSFVAALVVMLLLLIPERKAKPHPKLKRTSVGDAVLWSFLGILLAFVAQYVAVIIETAIFNVEPGSENTQEIVEMVQMVPVFALVVAIVGPILEELVFRKVLFGALYRRMNFFFAALISSVIFAAVHLDFTHLLIYTAVGFTFSFLYVKTGRIIVPIIAHVAMNGFVVITQVVFADQLEEIIREAEQAALIIGGLFL